MAFRLHQTIFCIASLASAYTQLGALSREHVRQKTAGSSPHVPYCLTCLRVELHRHLSLVYIYVNSCLPVGCCCCSARTVRSARF